MSTINSDTPSSLEPLLSTFSAILLSYIAYRTTASLIPLLGPNLVAKGLSGKDFLKPSSLRNKIRDGDSGGHVNTNESGNENGVVETRSEEERKLDGDIEIPETTGTIAAGVYILLLSLFAPIPFLPHLLPSLPIPPPFNKLFFVDRDFSSFYYSTPSSNHIPNVELDGRGEELAFPHHSLTGYLASLLSLLTATFLGFLDDTFDIRWRFKLPIPIIASVPLLLVYSSSRGITDIIIPRIFALRTLFGVDNVGGVFKLGPLYYVYMSMLSTFCTNSINILAGINGVEVSQSLIIALSLVLNDLLYLRFDPNPLLSLFLSANPPTSSPVAGRIGLSTLLNLVGLGFGEVSREMEDRHLFCFWFMMPLVGVCLGLLRWNWYPSRAFVGDSFCYFSGMAFAVVGILGHFSKTLLLFFIPQIFNFLYSCPQLFGLVECPRHRMPKFNPTTGLLEPSHVLFKKSSPPSRLVLIALNILYRLGLVGLTFEDGEDEIGGNSEMVTREEQENGDATTVRNRKGRNNLNDRKRNGQNSTSLQSSASSSSSSHPRHRHCRISSSTNLTLLNLLLVRLGPMREDELTKWVIRVQVSCSLLAFVIRYAGPGVVF